MNASPSTRSFSRGTVASLEVDIRAQAARQLALATIIGEMTGTSPWPKMPTGWREMVKRDGDRFAAKTRVSTSACRYH